MKILFTGASSFTGSWFARELARAGHEVVATFRRPRDGYADALRRQRVELVAKACEAAYGCAFGDERFLTLVRERGPWDGLCHHAADVTNYKSPDFDVVTAVRNNTQNLALLLRELTQRGCRRMVLTGSVFEQNEGVGSEGMGAFSPYGLSKGLTGEIVRYYAGLAGMSLGKFVIPNPFGPYEEPRFTSYLVKNWAGGQTPSVQTPAYVRDNIHVTLLAKAYGRFVETLPASGFVRLNPSGYVESQGAFALRFAREMEPRLGRACPVELKTQTEFAEPKVRIYTDLPDAAALGWDEATAWDGVGEYYRKMHGL